MDDSVGQGWPNDYCCYCKPFNTILLKKKSVCVHTHTHTHIYIYLYIYNVNKKHFQNNNKFYLMVSIVFRVLGGD